jgi:hypothetical protein
MTCKDRPYSGPQLRCEADTIAQYLHTITLFPFALKDTLFTDGVTIYGFFDQPILPIQS